MKPKAFHAPSRRLAPAYIARPTRLCKKVLDEQKITPYYVTCPHSRRICSMYAVHILELIIAALVAVVVATHTMPALI